MQRKALNVKDSSGDLLQGHTFVSRQLLMRYHFRHVSYASAKAVRWMISSCSALSSSMK